MILLTIHCCILALLLVIMHRLFIDQLISKNTYIANQIRYFLSKTTILFATTFFFCFFSPINSTKFILSSLGIFIVFHFIEALIIQNKLDMKESNG